VTLIDFERLMTADARSVYSSWSFYVAFTIWQKLVLGTRRKWPRPRRWQFLSRRERNEPTSRDKDVETETGTCTSYSRRLQLLRITMRMSAMFIYTHTVLWYNIHCEWLLLSYTLGIVFKFIFTFKY